MKEFARIVMDLGDPQMIRSLEKAMNTEIALEADLPSIYGDY